MSASIRMTRTLAATVALAAAAAHAGTYTETWSGFSSGPIAGTSSLPGFTLTYDPTAPQSSIGTNAGDKFPGLATASYLDTNGSVFDWVQLNGGSINLTSASVLQFALPIKVKSLGATAAASSIDIITIDQTAGSYSPIFGLRQDAGKFHTSTENGWPGAASPISTTAFDPATTSNWRDADAGRYHLLAFRVAPSTTPGTGSYKVFDINPATGVSTLLQSYTGATNTAVVSKVPRIAAGLCLGTSPVGTVSTRALVDDVTFWDDTFASDALFIGAVRTKYSVAPPSGIEGWDLY